MAGTLTGGRQWIRRFNRIIWIFSVVLVGCDQAEPVDPNALLIPERKETTYVTDQTYVAGNSLFLWHDAKGCQLQVTKEGGKQQDGRQQLTLKAPCYFIKSPGSDNVQVFRQDKTTRVVAVLGTPAEASAENDEKRCGKQVQGLVINRHGHVRLSERVLADHLYCADGGLDNAQYSLFHGS
ncbi:MAG: hypothetical protein ACPGVP_03850 [Thiolinea sp.]